MNITPEQEQEIANRLGITKPSKPKEVAEFLDRWNVYKQSVSEFRADRLDSWGNFEIIEQNAKAIESIRTNLKSIEAQGEYITNLGELTRLAVVAYEKSARDYKQAITDELERPRRVFEKAKSDFKAKLDKEARSLKYKATRTRNKSYDYPHESNERNDLLAQANEADKRLAIVEYLSAEVGYMSYSDGQVFTEEAVWQEVQRNEYSVNRFISNLAQIVTEQTESK